jgi:hypothetical protein
MLADAELTQAYKECQRATVVVDGALNNSTRKMRRALPHAMVILSLVHAIPTGAVAAPPSSPTPQMRTFVSGQGSDNNPCSVASPCRSLQAALALTIAGGEIYVLNSAGYGVVTINKSVTIVSEGAVAGVSATSGAGITINAGANDIINLRGIDIDGGSTASVGIQFNSGQSLNIQKVSVRGFTNTGINFAPNAGASALFISDTQVANNGSNGILVAPSGPAAVKGALSRVMASGNGLASSGVGIFVYGGNSTGALNITVTDTVASNNYYGIGAGAAAVMVRNSTVSNNAVGVRADQSAIVQVGQSTLTANGTGWQATNGGLLQSYGNNNVNGNTINGTLTSTLALQ